MNRIFFITFVTISVTLFSSVCAQEKRIGKFDKEVFDAKRNAFITAEVGLTPAEAAQFIPLCNELRQKIFEKGRECRKLSNKLYRSKEVSESDYEKIINANLNVDLEQAQLNKEYFLKFKKILSAEKIYKYMKAERKFVREYYAKEVRNYKRKK